MVRASHQTDRWLHHTILVGALRWPPMDHASADDSRPDPLDALGELGAHDAHDETDELDGPLDEVVEAAVGRALDRLPRAFSERLGSVAIVVEDEPTASQLASVGASGLFGLYQGVPRTAAFADGMPLPSKITIFKGPLTRAHWGEEALGRAVEETVLHEIAHHFGISDDRLRELHRER